MDDGQNDAQNQASNPSDWFNKQVDDITSWFLPRNDFKFQEGKNDLTNFFQSKTPLELQVYHDELEKRRDSNTGLIPGGDAERGQVKQAAWNAAQSAKRAAGNNINGGFGLDPKSGLPLQRGKPLGPTPGKMGTQSGDVDSTHIKGSVANIDEHMMYGTDPKPEADATPPNAPAADEPRFTYFRPVHQSMPGGGANQTAGSPPVGGPRTGPENRRPPVHKLKQENPPSPPPLPPPPAAVTPATTPAAPQTMGYDFTLSSLVSHVDYHAQMNMETGHVDLTFVHGNQNGPIPQVHDARSLGAFVGQPGGAREAQIREIDQNLGSTGQVLAGAGVSPAATIYRAQDHGRDAVTAEPLAASPSAAIPAYKSPPMGSTKEKPPLQEQTFRLTSASP